VQRECEAGGIESYISQTGRLYTYLLESAPPAEWWYWMLWEQNRRGERHGPYRSRAGALRAAETWIDRIEEGWPKGE
jgi:hypothetical protein